MSIYNGFDINTALTPRPWGPRDEQKTKDIIDTLVGDTIDGAKATSGHLHGKVYANDSIYSIDAISSTSLTVNLQDNISTGLVIKNRNNNNIIVVDSSTTTPIVAFGTHINVTGNVGIGQSYSMTYKLAVTGSFGIVGTVTSNGDSGGVVVNRTDGSAYLVFQNGSGVNSLAVRREPTTNDLRLHTYNLNGYVTVRKDYTSTALFSVNTNNGFVAIGGITAASLLDVNGEVASTNLKLYNSSDSLKTGLSYPVFYSSSGAGASYPYNESGHLILQPRCSADRDIILVTGSTPAIRVVVDAAGQTGFGTSDPMAMVHINGGNLLISNNNEIRFYDSTATSRTAISLTSSNVFALGTSNSPIAFYAGSGTYTERMRLYADGGLVMTGAGTSQGAGTINATALFDDGTPVTDYVFEKFYDAGYVVPQDNVAAVAFEDRYKDCDDLDSLASFVKNEKCLPAFNSFDTKSVGDRFQRLLETVEVIVCHLDGINERLKLLEA